MATQLNKLNIVLVLFFLNSCLDNDKSVVKNEIIKKPSSLKCIDTVRVQTLTVDNFNINGISFLDSKQSILNKLGKPDSITIKKDDMYNISSIEAMHYNNSIFYISRFYDFVGFNISNSIYKISPLSFGIGDEILCIEYDIDGIKKIKSFNKKNDDLQIFFKDTDGAFNIDIINHKVNSINYYQIPHYEYDFTTTYINALSGVNLREKPSIKSKIIKKIKYADRVFVSDTTNFEYKQELFNSKWIEVEVDEFKGYIPNLFITKFNVPVLYENGLEKVSLNEYVNRLESYAVMIDENNYKFENTSIEEVYYLLKLIKPIFEGFNIKEYPPSISKRYAINKNIINVSSKVKNKNIISLVYVIKYGSEIKNTIELNKKDRDIILTIK